MTNEATSAGGEETSIPVTAEKPPSQPRVTLPDLREEMDRLWDTVLSSSWRPFQSRSKALTSSIPAMDVFEKEGKFCVRAELPGIADKDVEVTVDAGMLTISGKKHEEHEVKEENYYRSERTFGSFSRQVSLPAGADTDKANARFKDGVLEVDIPLKAVEGAKKIEITPAK